MCQETSNAASGAILKSPSASKIFNEMPNCLKRYLDKHFWGGQPSGISVGPVGENIIKNYIRRQDVLYELFLPDKDEGKQTKQSDTAFVS